MKKFFAVAALLAALSAQADVTVTKAVIGDIKLDANVVTDVTGAAAASDLTAVGTRVGALEGKTNDWNTAAAKAATAVQSVSKASGAADELTVSTSGDAVTIGLDLSAYAKSADAYDDTELKADIAALQAATNALQTGKVDKEAGKGLVDLTEYATVKSTAESAVQTETDPVWTAEKGDYLTTADAASTYLTQTDAASTYVAKETGKALVDTTEYAGVKSAAESAVKTVAKAANGAEELTVTQNGTAVTVDIDLSAYAKSADAYDDTAIKARVSGIEAKTNDWNTAAGLAATAVQTETDPVWTAEKGDYLTTADAASTYVAQESGKGLVTLTEYATVKSTAESAVQTVGKASGAATELTVTQTDNAVEIGLDLSAYAKTADAYVHPAYDAAAAAAVKVGRDATGHVVLGGALAPADLGIDLSLYVLKADVVAALANVDTTACTTANEVKAQAQKNAEALAALKVACTAE